MKSLVTTVFSLILFSTASAYATPCNYTHSENGQSIKALIKKDSSLRPAAIELISKIGLAAYSITEVIYCGENEGNIDFEKVRIYLLDNLKNTTSVQ